MKNIYVFLFIVCSVALKSQTLFWAETFGNGTTCGGNQATLGNGFLSNNGTWSTTQTGLNDAFANIWYISQTEGGRNLNACGKGCLDSAGLVNRTLHIGNVPGSPFSALCPTGDCGANYDPGIGTNKVRTHTRIESPVISCVGKAGINFQFDYITLGNQPDSVSGDSVTVWYFNGAVWGVLTPTVVATATCSASPTHTTGIWGQTTYHLPPSANNNGAVRIGFEWVNNDDSIGTNPSVAIDNIKMLANTIGGGPSTLTITIVPPDTINLTPLYCTNTPYHFTGRANPGPILFYNWTSYTTNTVNATFNPSPAHQNGEDITFPLAGTYTLVMSANSQFNGIDSNQIIVTVAQTPTVNVTPANPTVCLNGTGTNLYANAIPATAAPYTYTWTSTSPVLPPTYLDANGDSVMVNPVPTPSNVVTYTVVGTSAAGCISVPSPITVTITAAPIPVYSVVPDTICNGSHSIITITNMPITTTYTWSSAFAGGLGTFSGPSAQVTPIYSGVVDTTFTYSSNVNVPGCPSYSVHIVKVVVKPTPVVKSVSDTSDNCNHLGAILAATSTPVSSTTTYSWTSNIHLSSTTGSSVTATPTVPTKYYVTSVLNGCRSTKDSVLVLIGDTTNASISSEFQIVCNGQKNQFIAYPQNSLLNNSYTYSWQPTTDTVSTSISGDTVVVQPTLSPGTIYTLTVHGTCVKHNVATYDITVNQCTPPKGSFTASTHTICVHHCITFKDSVQFLSTLPLSYKWVFVGGSISAVPTSTVSADTLFYEMTDSLPLKPVKVCYQINSLLNVNGYYPVIETVTNGLGQTITNIDSVRVDPGPTAHIGSNNQTVNEGTSATLTGAPSTGYANISSYSWALSDSGAISCRTCVSPVVTPTTTTQYTLTITDANGCSDTAITTVYVDVVCKDVFIATAFSPNGDGLNDVLHVKSNCGLTNMSFKIFDRWGEKVFESTDESFGWDGTFRNKAMNSDVFMYTLDGFLSSGVEVKKKGNVTLMR